MVGRRAAHAAMPGGAPARASGRSPAVAGSRGSDGAGCARDPRRRRHRRCRGGNWRCVRRHSRGEGGRRRRGRWRRHGGGARRCPRVDTRWRRAGGSIRASAACRRRLRLAFRAMPFAAPMTAPAALRSFTPPATRFPTPSAPGFVFRSTARFATPGVRRRLWLRFRPLRLGFVTRAGLFGAPFAPLFRAPSTRLFGTATPLIGVPFAPVLGPPVASLFGAPSAPLFGAALARLFVSPPAPLSPGFRSCASDRDVCQRKRTADRREDTKGPAPVSWEARHVPARLRAPGRAWERSRRHHPSRRTRRSVERRCAGRRSPAARRRGVRA